MKWWWNSGTQTKNSPFFSHYLQFYCHNTAKKYQKLDLTTSYIPLVWWTSQAIVLLRLSLIKPDQSDINALIDALNAWILCSLCRSGTIHPGKPCYFSTPKTREKFAPVLYQKIDQELSLSGRFLAATQTQHTGKREKVSCGHAVPTQDFWRLCRGALQESAPYFLIQNLKTKESVLYCTVLHSDHSNRFDAEVTSKWNLFLLYRQLLLMLLWTRHRSVMPKNVWLVFSWEGLFLCITRTMMFWGCLQIIFQQNHH